MKKHLFIGLLLILSFIAFPLTVCADGVPQAVLDASDSVVCIEVEYADGVGGGSGFIIENNADGTYIMTNNHVVEGNTNGVYVWVGDDEKRAASVVESSEQYDFAVIKLIEPIEAKELVLSTEMAQGDEVYAVGFPMAADMLAGEAAHASSEATITDGIISSVRNMKIVDYGPDVQILQINAEINPGNSGGPLLNRDGQVVGINSYGAYDSQGIFAAISSDELISFLQSNGLGNFGIAETVYASLVWLLYIVIGIIAVGLIACLIVILRKHRTKKKRAAIEEMKLAEYLNKLEQPLDAYSTVSLLMPVILQIRDKHNQGSVFLKLSPSRLSVTKEGCILRESSDMPTDEFIAPEQRSGGFAGIKADIYSVSAMLRYMLTYHFRDLPKDEKPTFDDAAEKLIEIANKGLSENMEDRFANMQELVLELSPFNTGVSERALMPLDGAASTVIERAEDEVEEPKETDKVPRNRKRLIGLLVSVGVGVLIIAFLGFSAINYFSAMEDAENYAFKEAEEEMSNVLFHEELFPEDSLYIDAGVEVLDREYNAAIMKLRDLDDYKGAEDLLMEARYRKAAMFADEDRYDDAIEIYEELGRYKEADDLVYDTTFRKACYYMSSGNHYQAALEQLQVLSAEGYEAAEEKMPELYYMWGLKYIDKENFQDAYVKMKLADGYQDANQLLYDLRDIIYYQAVDSYRAGRYVKAKNGLNQIGNYLDSDAYLLLIRAHTDYFYNDSDQLRTLIGFEDAAELILSSPNCAIDFLMGTWRGDSKYFTIDENKRAQSNMPEKDHGDFYSIEGGNYVVFDEDSSSDKKVQYRITVVDENCIRVFALKNNMSYTLYRQ